MWDGVFSNSNSLYPNIQQIRIRQQATSFYYWEELILYSEKIWRLRKDFLIGKLFLQEWIGNDLSFPSLMDIVLKEFTGRNSLEFWNLKSRRARGLNVMHWQWWDLQTFEKYLSLGKATWLVHHVTMGRYYIYVMSVEIWEKRWAHWRI